jgi:dimeric dUTPase (all-alpha-NTP-PPase superfamily)
MIPAILTMLHLQDKMNCKVHPDWVEQNYEWYRAIWVECAELMDHVGYKWWKHQETDIEQVRLEVIDIWHFGLSAMFDSTKDFKMMASNINEAIAAHEPLDLDIRRATEALAQNSLETGGFSVALFWNLLSAAGLDFDQLYRSYVGKNVLNFFRQDHGYKDGSYRKQWAGREDNEHLVELVACLDAGSEQFADDLYTALADRYAQTAN